MFDLNKELNEIIIKYNIDRQYSEFRKMLRAIELLNELVNTQDNDILFLVCSNTDGKMIRQDIRGKQEYEYLVVSADEKSALCNVDANKTIIVASYYFANEISSFLSLNGIEHICLYDYFLLNGLNIEHDYYDIFNSRSLNYYDISCPDYAWFDFYAEIFYDEKKIRNSNNVSIKKIYYERLIFKLIYIRDFITAKRFIDAYHSAFNDDVIDYNNAWSDISSLHNKAKSIMNNRSQKDIIVFWIDALSREISESEYMPFMNRISHESLNFENAYTVTPYTNPTLKTMLLGLKTVDDMAFKIKNIDENAKVIKTLKSAGIDFKYFGLENTIARELKSKMSVFHKTPAPLIYWNAVNDAINSDNPVFFLLHEFYETHSPCVSALLFDEREIYNSFLNAYSPGQRLLSIRYCDKQLEFYSSFFGQETSKVYMSDHGVGLNTYRERYHTILKLQGKNIPSRREKRIFSYINFDKLIDYTINPVDSKLDDLFSEIAHIQDLDHYNCANIGKMIYNKRLIDAKYFVGYNGVVTENDIYVRFNNGSESYQHIDNKILNNDRIEYLRSITGTEQININDEKHFKYAKYYYKVLDNYYNRNSEKDELKTKLLKKLFYGHETHLGIAVYPGGLVTAILLDFIGPELQGKVKYCIDRNQRCQVSTTGIPIIHPSKLSESPIDIVITTMMPEEISEKSYLDSETILKELNSENAQVINVYKYLEDNGIKCKNVFWYLEYTDSDFDVDFPFEDVYEIVLGKNILADKKE